MTTLLRSCVRIYGLSMATRAYNGTLTLRVSDKILLVITSTESKAMPWESFNEGEGAEAVLLASKELKGFFIEPGEILVGT